MFFVRETLNLNKILFNVSNSSVLKDFLFLIIQRCLLTHVVRIQKGTSIRMSCLLDRAISHPQSVRAASGLSTSQIPNSQVVFKSQYPLICGRMLNACGTHAFCLRGRGFRLVSSHKVTMHAAALLYEYSRRILQEDRNLYPSCLNDEQLPDASSLRTRQTLRR